MWQNCTFYIVKLAEHTGQNSVSAVGLHRTFRDEGSPALTDQTFWQLAKWCKTGGAYQAGMEYAQKISMAVFGRIIERSRMGKGRKNTNQPT